MRVQIFQVDAFASRRFSGNPAAVMLLDEFLPPEQLQEIAAENNLSETAFLVRDGQNYRLRWFTPKLEVPLCGHATLASAAVVLQRVDPQRDAVSFHTLSGELIVRRSDDRYVMNFPVRQLVPCETPSALVKALGCAPVEVLADAGNYTAVFSDESQIRTMTPDFGLLKQLDKSGIVVTAQGKDGYDMVSRYFAPQKGIDEDPVTGSVHCGLAPYWSARLGKSTLRAWQASARGGELICRPQGDRVELEGSCVFYLEGWVEI